jgi:8-oxo-dGTP diphosphatase
LTKEQGFIKTKDQSTNVTFKMTDIYTKPLIFVAAGLLLDEARKCLITQRPKGKQMEGFWEFPGGKSDKNEIPERALKRELHEELGIDVDITSVKPLTFVTHYYPDFYLFMPLFRVKQWIGNPQSKENQNLAWVKIEDLLNYDLLPADIPLVAFLQKNCGNL